MTGVEQRTVEPEDDGLRLDRWFKRHYPGLSFGRLQKLLRTGQVRLDGARAKPSDRVSAGQSIRVPPLKLDDAQTALQDRKAHQTARLSEDDVAFIRSMVLHRDDDLIVLNKPAGLAVQGGTKTSRHVDGLLDGLRFDAKERPKLVHRIDKDTSGLLLLARSTAASRALTAAFKAKTTRKLYWAIAVGQPKPAAGKIDAPLAKRAGGGVGAEKMTVDDEGKRAVTLYRTVEHASRRVSWVALEPITGRTHQLRVHLAEILGCPILGDGKYAGQDAFVDGAGVSRKLHLHARGVILERPGGGLFEITAPLSDHMEKAFRFFGFDDGHEEGGFSDPDDQPLRRSQRKR
ncbi:MAG: RluA family pseudouridine synthase [Magnetovibrionaceae bacterium]